jgi:hypothetical protein
VVVGVLMTVQVVLGDMVGVMGVQRVSLLQVVLLIEGVAAVQLGQKMAVLRVQEVLVQ